MEDNVKEEQERKKRALEYDKSVFGKYFEKVRIISNKIQKSLPQGFSVKGKTVIGISKAENEEPRLVFASGSSLAFSKVNFNSL